MSDRPSIVTVLTAKKEISLGWLLGAVGQGLVSFAVLVWTAATMVSDVSALKDNYPKQEQAVRDFGVIVGAHAVELERQREADKGFETRLDAHDRALERLQVYIERRPK